MANRLTGIEVSEYQGQAADPPVSPAGTARVYFNTTASEWRISISGGPYVPIGGSSATISPFPLTNSPAALWDFSSETLLDTSGNGNTLAAELGTARFGQFVPGVTGLWLDGSTVVSSVDPAPASLVIEGDVTVLMMFRFEAKLAASVTLVALGDSGVNQAYSTSVGTGVLTWSWNHQNGGGVNNNVDLTPGVRRFPIAPDLVWLGLVRDATAKTVASYVAGREFAAPIGYANNPDTTAAGRFRLGSSVTTSLLRVPSTVFYSVKVVPIAYSLAQIQAEWNATMGPAYGLV